MPLSPYGISMCQVFGVEAQAEGEGIHGRGYEVTIIGVDLAKNVFQLHGADGFVVFHKKLSRP